MGPRNAVAGLYVVGALVTAAGLLWAYWSAARRVRAFDELVEWSRSLPDVDFAEGFEASIGPDEDAPRRRAQVARNVDDERVRRLRQLGVESSATYGDLEIPAEVWSRRAALHDALEAFRSGGLVALVGLVVLTVASVWSLYLPA